STIIEGLFFSTSIPQLVLNIRSASTVVAIQRLVQPRGSVASILLHAKCLTLRPVGCNEMFDTNLTTRLLVPLQGGASRFGSMLGPHPKEICALAPSLVGCA